MEFRPASHFSGSVSDPLVDLTAHAPWLYIIACMKPRLLYIGETYDSGGLIVRLGSHFGPFTGSTLRQSAAKYVGSTVTPPFIVVAAYLPTDDPEVQFDASSKNVRLACEALVHTHIARIVLKKEAWTIISSSQITKLAENTDIEMACESIANCFDTTLDFLSDLTTASPFHLVTLGRRREILGDADIGELLNQIEVMLYDWLLHELKEKFGERWWVEGVPVASRKQCATRSEEEGRGHPSEAYLTFIDLRDIIRSNWDIFGPTIEKIAEERGHGKDRATKWLVELNEMRKIWAHPIKQRFQSLPADSQTLLQSYRQKLRLLV